MVRGFAILLALAALAATPCGAQAQASSPPVSTTQQPLVDPYGLSEASPFGWHPDFLGPLRGYFDASFGVKLWPNRSELRNLIFGGTVDLAQGLRAHAILMRRDGEEKFFEIDTDEAYLEAFNQYRSPQGDAGIDLKLGRTRYLHFPYPDAIATFDNSSRIEDILTGNVTTDYRNALLEAEASLHMGLGAHWTGIADDKTFNGVIEAYAFYRHDIGAGWHVEARAGDIAPRQNLYAHAGEPGYDLYAGKQLGEFNVGLLYEHKQNEANYTGIMVQFRPTAITRAVGHVDLDYSRTPDGITAQIPLYHARFNEDISTKVRSGEILVGEVRAIRMRTVWEAGYVRNEYEHRLESWGETTDSRLHCVVTEEPWYLQAEALVSPHSLGSTAWFRDRLGPGQYLQRVTYRYYRQKPTPPDTKATS